MSTTKRSKLERLLSAEQDRLSFLEHIRESEDIVGQELRDHEQDTEISLHFIRRGIVKQLHKELKRRTVPR